MRHLIYAFTLLISSSLLFVVQPIVGKMVQPVLGGTPAVWNTAMLFFQVLLLGGYLYAHLSTQWLGSRRQSILHLVILAVGLFFLPIGFDAPADPASLDQPALWLLGALVLGVGWPFFVISTSAPLLQKWFSNLDHPDAADPYYLYAASNIGSVVALLAYPFLIEPRIGLQMQTFLWAAAYGVLCLFVALCAYLLWKTPAQRSPDESKAPPEAHAPLTWRRRGRWILWAFIPSSMMLGVTTFVTTDVAPMPLLWIPPLAVFLISFIVVFARTQPIPQRLWYVLFPTVLMVLATIHLHDLREPLWVITALNFGGLFVFAMTFHGLLAQDRPSTDHLTAFYLWMSVGGALGGVFNALIAPLIFDRLLEYPVVLAIAALLFPRRLYRRPLVLWSLRIALSGALLFTAYQWLSGSWGTQAVLFVLAASVIALATLSATRWRKSWISYLLTMAMIAVTLVQAQGSDDEILAERSFFGTHRVHHFTHSNVHALYHGTTLHGLQFRDGDLSHQPVSYYYNRGPIGQVLHHLHQRNEGHPPLAVAGLGTGGLAVYAQPGQVMDFYEIDPAVRDIANNPDYFSYLRDCQGDCSVIMGDARLQLEAAPDDYYQAIILDAYSSTAIPVHLMTREAIEIYLQKLRPGGILAFHISSRHIDLEPPLTAAAEELGLVNRVQSFSLDRVTEPHHLLADSSEWLVMARSREDLGLLAFDDDWENLRPPDDFEVWTDDYANILRVYDF